MSTAVVELMAEVFVALVSSAIVTFENADEASSIFMSIVPLTAILAGASSLNSFWSARETASSFLLIKNSAAATAQPTATNKQVIMPMISPSFFFFLTGLATSSVGAFSIGRAIGSSFAGSVVDTSTISSASSSMLAGSFSAGSSTGSFIGSSIGTVLGATGRGRSAGLSSGIESGSDTKSVDSILFGLRGFGVPPGFSSIKTPYLKLLCLF